jgi:hypothetical protein
VNIRDIGARSILAAALFALGPGVVLPQDPPIQVKPQQIEGPSCASVPVWQSLAAAALCRDDELMAWLEGAIAWRKAQRIRVGFRDDEYRRPDLAWTQTDYIQTQMMVHERFFYDPVSRRYTVSRYLDDLQQRYGGVDSVLVWQSALRFAAEHVPLVVDTTAAGDSFNAAFLAAWLSGRSPQDCCRIANALAAIVIQHRGAIIPATATPSLEQLLAEGLSGGKLSGQHLSRQQRA